MCLGDDVPENRRRYKVKHTPARETVVQPAVQRAPLRRLCPVNKVFWNWQQNPTQKLPSKLLWTVLVNEVSAQKFAHLGKKWSNSSVSMHQTFYFFVQTLKCLLRSTSLRTIGKL